MVGIHAHVPGMLSRDPHSECGCYSVHAHLPFMESEMVTLGAYHGTSPTGTSVSPPHQAYQITIY